MISVQLNRTERRKSLCLPAVLVSRIAPQVYVPSGNLKKH